MAKNLQQVIHKSAAPPFPDPRQLSLPGFFQVEAGHVAGFAREKAKATQPFLRSGMQVLPRTQDGMPGPVTDNPNLPTRSQESL